MAARPYPKDWERKLRVIGKLYERGVTAQALADSIGVQKSHLSEVIWGTRKSPIMETRIAEYFGMTREELFPKKKTARAQGEAA